MMDAIVSARHLGKTIAGKTILRDISVDAEQGDVVGIIGKNGAGKTTFLDVLLGFSPPSTGAVKLFGSESSSMPASARKRIGFVPQEDELLNQLTGAQQLALNAALHAHWDGALIDRLAREWGTPLDTPVEVLSTGERQKLATLLALGHEPDLLVLDEPAASLDPLARRQFLQMVLEISASATRTVLFSTHIVSDLERVANQIWVMREGRLVWQGALDTLKESVVRLTIRSTRPLPTSLGIQDILSERMDGTWASVVVSRWNPAQRTDLERRLDAQVAAENLSLEDIFVELHS